MKSKIQEISFKYTHNLGNFESCTVSATVSIVEGDVPNHVMAKLKRWVTTQCEEGPYEEEDDLEPEIDYP